MKNNNLIYLPPDLWYSFYITSNNTEVTYAIWQKDLFFF